MTHYTKWVFSATWTILINIFVIFTPLQENSFFLKCQIIPFPFSADGNASNFIIKSHWKKKQKQKKKYHIFFSEGSANLIPSIPTFSDLHLATMTLMFVLLHKLVYPCVYSCLLIHSSSSITPTALIFLSLVTIVSYIHSYFARLKINCLEYSLFCIGYPIASITSLTK